MITFLIEALVLCVLFTVMVLASMKDPLKN